MIVHSRGHRRFLFSFFIVLVFWLFASPPFFGSQSVNLTIAVKIAEAGGTRTGLKARHFRLGAVSSQCVIAILP